jgi:Fic family protein
MEFTKDKLKSSRAGDIVLQPGDYYAYLPHKIAPNGPSIRLDSECMRLLSEADRALGELKGTTGIISNPDLFVAFYVRKEALLSSQIEGTECSLDEVIQAENDGSRIKPVDEVINYINAMNYGIDKLRELPLCLRLINNMHRQLLAGVRGANKAPGEYKRLQNWVGPPGCKIEEATYIPPPPPKMLEYMGDLENYCQAKDQVPPLIKAAIIHYYFETIHPYTDGNGRLGRLLITFLLCQKKVLDKPLLYLSLFFKENKTYYFDALMDVRLEGEWEEWIKFFLRGVRNTSQEANTTAKDIKILHDADRALLKEKLSQYKLTFPCYDLLCKEPIIAISQATKRLNTNYPSVKKVFDNLIKLGILELYTKKKARYKLFCYYKYLEILKRGT